MIHNFLCPLCKQNQSTNFISTKDYFLTQENFEILTCSKCGFKHTFPFIAENAIGKYYLTEKYLSHSKGTKSLMYYLYSCARYLMFYFKYRIIKRNINASKKLSCLDFGCGIGTFVHELSQRGHHVQGMDISNESARVGKNKYNIEIKPNANLYQEPNAKYDVISLWHVIEHLHNLDNDIAQLKNVLKDDGILILAMPNHQSFDAKHYQQYWAAWDTPRHLWHFDYSSLKQLADKHHFSVIDFDFLPFDTIYVSMISENYKKSSLSFIKGALWGTWFLCKSLFNKKASSSLVYVLQKK